MLIAIALFSLVVGPPRAAKPLPQLKVIAERPLGPNLRVQLAARITQIDGPYSRKEYVKLWIDRRTEGKWRRIETVRVEARGDDGGDLLALSAGDFDGDGRREMAVSKQDHCQNREPGGIFVFRWDGRRIRRLGSVVGNRGSEMGDLNRDGKWEARVYNDVGRALPVFWPDHYRVQGNRLVRVNPAFRRTYIETRKYILDRLGDFPWDDDIWVVYGRALKYARIKESPRHAYREVIRLARKNAIGDVLSDMNAEGIRYLEAAAKDNDPFPTSFDYPSDYPDPYHRP